MFMFKIWIDEADEEPVRYTGFVPGGTYKEALLTLANDFFQEEEIVRLELVFVTENKILFVPMENLAEIKENNNW